VLRDGAWTPLDDEPAGDPEGDAGDTSADATGRG
jgi:hypothetical protein